MKKSIFYKAVTFCLVLCLCFGNISALAEYKNADTANISPAEVSVPSIDNGTLILEAEDMTAGSYAQIIEDANASGGKAIKFAPPSWRPNVDPDAPPDLKTEFLSNDNYHLFVWIRYKAETDGSNSVFYALNSSEYSAKHFNAQSGYGWLMIGNLRVLKGERAFVNFQYREMNFVIDKLIISDDVSFFPTTKDDVPGSCSPIDYTGLFPEPTLKPVSGHPRLLFTSSDIPKILAYLQKEENQDIFGRAASAADTKVTGLLDTSKLDNFNSSALTAIMYRSLFYALGLRDAAHARIGIDAMHNYMSTVAYNPNTGDITREMGKTMMAAAAVYDWCYDIMTEEEKNYFIKMMKYTAMQKEIGYPPVNQLSISGHGGEGEIFGHLLSAGIAVYDEDPEMYDLAAGRMFAEYLDIRKLWNASGGHYAGHDYGTTRFGWELYANLLYTRMGYEEGILGDLNDIANVTKKFIYARLPMGFLSKWGDSWAWSLSNNKDYSWKTYDNSVFNYSSAQVNDPYVEGFARIDNALASNPLCYDPIIPSVLIRYDEKEAKSIDELPLVNKTSYPLTSIQARTNWTLGQDSNAAVAQFEAREKRMLDHQHADLGTFQLYYKGGLAIDAGSYGGSGGGWGGDHFYNYYTRTVAKNGMLVYDPSEQFYVDYFDKTGKLLSNDGGQFNSQTVSTYEEYMSNPDEAKTEAWYVGPNKKTPEFSLLKTNITGSYGNNKVKNHERSMVFIDLDNDDYPAALVVFDDITSADKTFKKSWIMNTVLEPQINGNTTTVIRNDDGNNGKLVNKTLLPESVTIQNVGGEGKESFVDGVNYETKPNAEGIKWEAGSWRFEVSPTNAKEHDYFLNSMYVTDYDRNLPELPMYKEDADNFYGVTLKDRAVYFSKNDALNGSSYLTLRGNGYAEVKCLVSDVKPGLWRVTNTASSSSVTYRVEEEENSLYFRGTPGTYLIEKAASGTAAAIEYTEMTKPRYGDFMVYNSSKKMFYALNKPTVMRNGSKLVPIKEMLEYGGYTITDNGSEITASNGTIEYRFTIGKPTLYTNGSSSQMSAAPVVIDGTAYANIADFACFNTSYNSKAKLLFVTVNDMSGSEIANASPKVSVVSSFSDIPDTLPVGTNIKLSAKSSFCDYYLDNGGYISLYHNDTLLGSSSQSDYTLSLTVNSRINNIYAAVYSSGGELIAKSDTITINGMSLIRHKTGNWFVDTETNSGKYNWNFNQSANNKSDTNMYTAQIAAEYIDENTGEIRNNVGIATWDNTKNLDGTQMAEGSMGIVQVQAAYPNQSVNNMNKAGGQGRIFEAGVELKYSKSELNKDFGLISCNVYKSYDETTGYGDADWADVSMSVTTDGYIRCSGVKTEVKADITSWHKYSIKCDTETDIMYFYVDDECIYSKKSANDIKGLQRCNTSFDKAPGERVTGYFDNAYINTYNIRPSSLIRHVSGNWSMDTETNSAKYNWNFNQSANNKSDTNMYTTQIAAEYIDEDSGEIRNNVGIATWDNTKNLDGTAMAEGSMGIVQVQAAYPNQSVNNMNKVGGQGRIFEAGVELKYSKSELNKDFGLISCNVYKSYDETTGYGEAAWADVSMSVTTDGYINCSGVKTEVKADITSWHKYSIKCDTETDIMYFYVDDECIYSKKSANDIKGLQRFNTTFDKAPGEKVTAYFDNAYINTYDVEFDGDSSNLTVKSGNTVIDSLSYAHCANPLTVSGFVIKKSSSKSRDTSLRVYAALYRGNTLCSVKSTDITLSDDYNVFNLAFDEVPTDINTGCSMKLFAWNSSFKPYFVSTDPFSK